MVFNYPNLHTEGIKQNNEKSTRRVTCSIKHVTRVHARTHTHTHTAILEPMGAVTQ